MHHILRISVLLTSMTLVSFCANTTEDNVFYVNHKGAQMPVRVKGNVVSKNFLFMISGGGTPGLLYQYMPPYQKLQKDYALIYWDRRGSEFSQGNPDPSTYLWGRHDGFLPVELGQYQMSRLTSVSVPDKSMVIFESSAHQPMVEEGDKFYSEVKSFADRYK